jgi:hypothetical protein
MGNTTGAWLGFLAGCLAGSFISALIIQYATKWVAGFRPSYKQALLAAFLAYIACYVIGGAIGFLIVMSGSKVSGASMVLITIAGFLVQAAFYSMMVKSPEGMALSFGKACLVCLIQIVVAGIAVAGIFLMGVGAFTLSKP